LGKIRRSERTQWRKWTRELGLLVSPDTLLNRIRASFRADAEDVRVLGVDDFGFRRDSAPGTILVDLERHKVVDLFEGHSMGSIARWLGWHPDVEVVARARSPVCRDGVNAGAPEALQVADRWHLLRSLAVRRREAGPQEGELGSAKGEGIGGPRTASAAGQANGPDSPKVRENPDFMSRSATDTAWPGLKGERCRLPRNPAATSRQYLRIHL
jgi:hypothetical protein